jgi:ABC-type transport system involved in cytochrome bd biosynthesis fused ATPase/permease subunit
VINRSTTRDTPIDPMALYLVALLFGTLVAETILASVHVRAHQKAGHMGASDLIKTLQKHLARRGPSTYGSTRSGLCISWIRSPTSIAPRRRGFAA